jgi:hypothetical protein
MSMVARLSTIELIQKQTDERILGMAWQAWLVKQGVQGNSGGRKGMGTQ